MIKVVLAHSVAGRYHYSIATTGTRLAGPLGGLSATPLLDACRLLQRMGAADDDAEIGLFDDGNPGTEARLHTTVGYGAEHAVVEEPKAKIVEHHPPPPDAGLREEPSTAGALKSSGATDVAPEAEKPLPDDSGTAEAPIDETSTKSEAAPRPRSRPPRSRADTDQVPPAPAKPRSSPRKRKPTKSGGRQGRR